MISKISKLTKKMPVPLQRSSPPSGAEDRTRHGTPGHAFVPFVFFVCFAVRVVYSL
jgi:hypothetical protein